jgi:hypothetical protein
MSRGLGKLQERLVAISTATKTIWDILPNGFEVEVADTTEKTAGGVTTEPQDGYTWKQTGEPWFCATTKARNLEHWKELQAGFRRVAIVDRKPGQHLFSACWSMHHIRATLWPELWKPGNNCVDLPLAGYQYRTFPQIPPDIKKARNVAQAGLSRAIASLESRGMLMNNIGCVHTEKNDSSWNNHGGRFGYESRFHVLAFVLDKKLCRQ